MDVVTVPLLELDDQFARELPELSVERPPQPVPEPALVYLNEALALELGLEAGALRSPAGVAVLGGNASPAGARPVAQAYAGHQFGGYSPQLGDGRALLLGELRTADGSRRDVHLKGSGRTPFARGGDGRAALGPMLRELVISEAMHALGIPTTRSLAVTTTGDSIVREVDGRVREVPGAVLTRIAASHLRVGTFQYAAATGDRALLVRVIDHTLARHVSDAPADASEAERALALYDHVIDVQASLIAQWMHVGFIHGVMNTDNMTISGETIDYGPCAFLDAYDPATVYSSIDHGGRYAYGNQPAIATWNLARLGETLLAIVDDDPDTAVERTTERLQRFPDLFRTRWADGMRAKLGIDTAVDDDTATAIVGELLDLLASGRTDYTGVLRSLSDLARGNRPPERWSAEPELHEWAARWRPLLAPGAADAMDAVNPIVIPRNHLVEAALSAATDGELAPLVELLDAVRQPFVARPGLERYAAPAPDGFADGYRTFCGT